MSRTTRVPKGFEISFNERYQLLSVRAWGLWDKDFSQKCCRMLAEKIRETGGKHPHWSMLFDMKDLHPQSPDCECLVEKQVKSAQAEHAQKIGILETSQLSDRQPFAQNHGQTPVRIGDEKDIWDWLIHHDTNEIETHKEPLNAV